MSTEMVILIMMLVAVLSATGGVLILLFTLMAQDKRSKRDD